MSPELRLVIDELVLDGVAAGDPVVEQSIARALGPALDEHGLSPAVGPVTNAVAAAVGAEASR